MAVALGMGDAFAAVLTEGGGLWVFGCHKLGALGLGPPSGIDTPARETPTLLGGVGTPVTGSEGGGPGADTHPFRNEPLVMVAAGYGHVAAVTDRGGVWVWGGDHREQLGPVPRQPLGPPHINIPTQWPSSACGGSPVVMVACGEEHTLALTRAGHVWACGYGLHGQNGLAERGRIIELTQVPGVEHITLVAAGPSHSAAVATDGRLWSWGDEDACPRANDEQPGFRAHETMHVPRALELASFGGSAVVSVTAGPMHSAAVTAAGELWTWGRVLDGALGLDNIPSTQWLVRAPRRVGAPDAPAFAGARALMAACGFAHTVVLTDGGAVWTCGEAYYGALGDEEVEESLVPTRIDQARFGGHRVVCVAAGNGASMAVTAEGLLYSWGARGLGHGGLGVLVPTVIEATLPAGARAGRTCAIPRGHVLALVMGAHARLGADAFAHVALHDDPLWRIARAARRLRGAYLHMGEGLLRMLAVRLRAAGD